MVETRRTRAPDAGTEWYDVYDDGHEEGFQAKFYETLADALGGMRASVEAIARHRPRMSRLTFVVPFNLTDNPGRTTDQHRWENAKDRWATEIDGAEDIDFRLVRGSDVLERLSSARHAGRRAFWFEEFELSVTQLDRWWHEFRAAAGDRYTPEANADLGLGVVTEALTVSGDFRDHVAEELDSVTDALERVGRVPYLADEWDDDVGDVPRDLIESPVGEWDQPLAALAAWLEAARAAVEGIVPGEDWSFADRSTVRGVRRDLDRLETLISSQWHVAGPGQCVALSGRGGAGKTHFVADATRELLNIGVPALVLAGGRFADGPWWPSFTDQLGIEVDLDIFFGGLNSFAAATDRRAVIAIDAINEAEQPWRWRTELPALIATVRRFDHLSLLITCRDEYVEGIVVAADPNLPIARHPGVEWADRSSVFDAYEDFFDVEVPRDLRNDPALDLPLLIKLACQLYSSNDPPIGPLARNDLFRAWVADRAGDINQALRIDPDSPSVRRAIALIARRVFESTQFEVPRDQIEADINALAQPGRKGWPWTLFQQLREAGVIDVVAGSVIDTEVVRFPYETLSSHLLVDQLFRDADSGLVPDPAALLATRPRLWAAAASVVPERVGTELPLMLAGHDVPGNAPDDDLLFAESLLQRSPGAVTDDTESELRRLLTAEPVAPEVVLAVVRLAMRDHRFNGNWLHLLLADMDMSARDASWGIGSYDAFYETAVETLTLLMGDFDVPAEQRLVAMKVLTWWLETPNRPVRDSLTKLLVESGSRDPTLITSTIKSFLGVDSPYAIERLLLVAYGVLMLADEPLEVHRELARVVTDAKDEGLLPPNILVDDHVHGIMAWVAASALDDDSPPSRAVPVGNHSPPGPAPSAEELEERHGYESNHPATRILASCLTWMGDFHKYVMTSAVETFSTRALPGRDRGAVPDEDDGAVSMEWAGQWVAARAIALGWTSERFADFEQERREDAGRAAHKAERFGKKYQWLAFHELVARLAANLRVAQRYSDSPDTYQGPWQWYGRDVDPTLQPSTRVGAHQVAPNGLVDFGPLSCAEVNTAEPDDAEAWARHVDPFPEPDAVLAGHATDSLALFRYEKWTRDAGRSVDREQWVILQSWIVRRDDLDVATEVIVDNRANWGRWMPEPDRVHHSYLGEGPWAPVRSGDYAETWVPLRTGADGPAIEVLPATRGYLWEGGVTRDCSLDDSVNLQLIGDHLTEGSVLQPRSVTYIDGGARTVGRATRARDTGQLTSIDTSWLDERLRALGAGLVLTIIGERRATQAEDATNWRRENSFGTELWTVMRYEPGSGLTGHAGYQQHEAY